MYAMIFGTYKNAPYHPFQGIDSLLSDLFAHKGGCEVTDQLDDLTRLDRNTRLAISYLDQWDDPIPSKSADALLRFVQEGGGLLVLHNGISLQADDRLRKMIGGKFDHHPPQEPITFSADEGTLLDGIKPFTLSEEPYVFTNLESDIHPLMHYTYRDSTYLAGWEHRFGKGRVIYLTPGHTIETFRIERYQHMIRRCAMIAERK